MFSLGRSEPSKGPGDTCCETPTFYKSMYMTRGLGSQSRCGLQKILEEKAMGEGRRVMTRGSLETNVRSSGFRRDRFVRAGIFHMARGPGIAGGLGRALIDSLIEELGRL